MATRWAVMNFHRFSTWTAAEGREAGAVRKWRPRLPSGAQHILLSIFGTLISIAVPALLAFNGWGMSRQDESVVFDTGVAALLATIGGFIMIRRLLTFPLLGTSMYAALTFMGSFALVAMGLKFF